MKRTWEGGARLAGSGRSVRDGRWGKIRVCGVHISLGKIHERAAQALCLLLQLPLLLLVAVYNPLEEWLEGRLGSRYYLSVPAVKFSIAFVCDGGEPHGIEPLSHILTCATNC